MKGSLVNFEMEDDGFIKLVIAVLVTICLIGFLVFLYIGKDRGNKLEQDLSNKKELPRKSLKKEKINELIKVTNESTCGLDNS